MTSKPQSAFQRVRSRRAAERIEGQIALVPPPADMTFRQWVESLAQPRVDPSSGKPLAALKVDGKPFKLDDRPAMAWIYEQVPSTREDAFRSMLILRKCAQVGFTVMEMLATIYLGLKFGLKVAMFLPSMQLAQGKSAERFMPIVRSIPEAYELLTSQDETTQERPKGEGNVLTRRMGASLFHFLWTSGKTATESWPVDVLSFDEVQEMLIADMEKAVERLSASDFKYTLMGSTANWPDADIDYWYKLGSQWRFHTRCPTCGVEEPLDDYFPACIQFDPDFPDLVTKVPGDYRYVCRAGHWIDDPQQGTWTPDNPDADLRRIKSIHFHQMLSPTISPREVHEAYVNASDMKNFFNRKLGKPYQDPSQIPVTLAHLNACAEEGVRLGLEWKKRARDTVMGIDQMGAFNVVIIKERLPDNRQAVVHVEEIYDLDPFRRCSELMDLYGVRTCVVEQLPNFNDAMRFANSHPGRVFLANGYGDLGDDVYRWGDAPKLDTSDRRTDEMERTRYTVRIDQYKAMSLSLARFVDCRCLFPDPKVLTQEIRVKDSRELKPILKDVVFLHFQKTAIVTERINEGERKLRRKVVKVGIDPHFSFANMLCDAAYARANGTATFILPDIPQAGPMAARPMFGNDVVADPDSQPVALLNEIRENASLPKCRDCSHYPLLSDGPPAHAHCSEYGAKVSAKDPGCVLHSPAVQS
jgi:hypothetical protein